MNEEQLGTLVSSWLKEGNRPPSDPNASVRTAMNAASETRQLRRWRWLPPFVHRMSDPPSEPHAVNETTDYQPNPILATNGHTPTVIGRTQSMLSPAKAITAGAIVAAVGGVFLIAQPFQQQGSVPGAADAPTAPVAVTATSYAGSCPGDETTETIGAIERTTGGYCNPTWDWSDDRLDGKVTWASNDDRYTDGSGLSIGMLALSFENDEGAWRMRPLPYLEFPDVLDTGPEVWILDGEGAYDGLTVVLVVDEYEPHGFIIDGDLPPAPENASTK